MWKYASKLLNIWPVSFHFWLCLFAVDKVCYKFWESQFSAEHALRFYTPDTVSCMMLVAVSLALVVFGYPNATSVAVHQSA